MGLFDIVTEEIDNIPIIKILISSGLEKPYYIKNKGCRRMDVLCG